MKRILPVDDEVIIATRLQELLISFGYDVPEIAGSAEEAIDLAKTLKPDLIIMDIKMPGPMDGLAAAEKIRADLDIPVIFLTAFSDEAFIARAKLSEPLGYILKPFENNQVQFAIELALHKNDVDKRLKEANQMLEHRVRLRTAELTESNFKLFEEIQEHKKTEASLAEQTRRNETILQTATEGFWVIDANGMIQEVNPSAASILGYLPEELQRKSIYDFEPEDQRRLAPHIRKAVRKGANQYEAQLLHKEGNVVSLEFSTNYLDFGESSFLFSFFSDVTKRNELVKSQKDREAELKIKTQNLKEVNTALKSLLKKRDSDRMEVEEKVLFNVKEMISPYIKKLKESELNEKQGIYLTILESNVKDIISPFSPKLTSRHYKFTKSELQIAKLVRMGITSKEIAELMGLSRRTIESHRDRIRKKIGLDSRKRNLRTFLMSID
ncbi:MAG: response regulator [Pseudomonadota bacterium]